MSTYKVCLSSFAAKHKAFWSKASDFIEGDESQIISSTYLQSYLTELTQQALDAKVFERRISRSYPLTLSESIVLQHQAVCSQPMVIEGFDGGYLDDLRKNITGHDQDSQALLSDQLWWHFSQGYHGILVEAPSAISETAELAAANGERTFQTLFKAHDIIRCEVFKSGPLIGRVKEVILRVEPKKDGTKTYDCLRRYAFKNESDLGKGYFVQALQKENNSGYSEEGIDYEIISTDDGALDQIPFVAFGRGRADSSIRLVLPLDIALINRLSIFSNINYHQGFQRNVVTGVSDELNQIGENIITTLSNPDAGVHTIPAGESTSVENEIRLITHWSQRLGLMQFNQLMDDTRQVQSAESKSKDLQARAKYYNDTLNDFETKLARVYTINKQFYSEQSDKQEVSVKIGRDFGLVDTELELQQDTMLYTWAGDFSDAGWEVKKAIVKKHFAKLQLQSGEGGDDEAERERIMDLLEKQQPPSYRATLYDAPIRRLSNIDGEPGLDEKEALN